MKKMVMFSSVFALVIMFIGISTALAGGDKNRGDIGEGSTHEINCEDQPCFEDAPMPGPTTMTTLAAPSVVEKPDETEVHDLLFIREEEKMARDVYHVLYEMWGNPIFANIETSEQTHMDAVKELIIYYGETDPVTNDDTGMFTDSDIADLYSFLVEWGSQSELDALLVGAYIEEYDILDIWKAYEETDAERAKTVYQNLYEGSYNHLDAFVYVYELESGMTYEPDQLTADQYEYVMSFDTQANQAQQPKQQKGK
jgi:hypothetical protein